MAIPMLKIRRPTGRLIFNMGIPIPGKTVFLIETGSWCHRVHSDTLKVDPATKPKLSSFKKPQTLVKGIAMDINMSAILVIIVIKVLWSISSRCHRRPEYSTSWIVLDTTPDMFQCFVNILGWQCIHGDVIKWKHFPRYWPFVRGIHRSSVNSSHKGQWRGTLMFSLIFAWTNNRDAGDLRRNRAHYDVTVMLVNHNARVWMNEVNPKIISN